MLGAALRGLLKVVAGAAAYRCCAVISSPRPHDVFAAQTVSHEFVLFSFMLFFCLVFSFLFTSHGWVSFHFARMGVRKCSSAITYGVLSLLLILHISYMYLLTGVIRDECCITVQQYSFECGRAVLGASVNSLRAVQIARADLMLSKQTHATPPPRQSATPCRTAALPHCRTAPRPAPPARSSLSTAREDRRPMSQSCARLWGRCSPWASRPPLSRRC